MSEPVGGFVEAYSRGVGADPPPAGGWDGNYSLRPSVSQLLPAEPFALRGCVITPSRAISDAYVVVDSGAITDVVEKKPDIADVRETNGVIMPGLIDMHNHPDYNVFAAWEPPGEYANRYEWRASKPYDLVVKLPQQWLLKLQANGKMPEGTQLRYAEIRALVGGVTAIQGVNDPQDTPMPQPLVRHIDRWIFGQHRARTMLDLPTTSSPDANTLKSYLADDNVDAFYLHLCEGKRGDGVSAQEFQRFLDFGADVAKTIIIHGTALDQDQIRHVAQAGCKLVWSPESNLRLYGQTTLAVDAIRAGMPVTLGPDWLPSGSTSLLGELKVARRVLAEQGLDIGADTLVRMVTSDAARIAGLGDHLGALEPGHAADILVLERRHDDPYENVVCADPSWVDLVIIGGDIVYARADSGYLQGDGTETLFAWGKQMVIDTRSGADAGATNPSLAQVRTLLTTNYPPVGPIFA
jgi:5-methylthioadenosine/S-adenosylhomocysteine deaminase